MTQNTRRFGLHLVFAIAAAVCLVVGQDAGLLNLSPQVQAGVIAAATAGASFFRGKAAE